MTITAKYQSKCIKCGSVIQPGEQIDWQRGLGSSHIHCPEVAAPVAGQVTVTIGSANKMSWQAGQVVRNRQAGIDRGEPEWLNILDVSSRYYREDGMSFGVGDESGYVYTLVCREATSDESAALRAKRDEKERKALALTELKVIANDVQNLGEKPEGQHTPDGEAITITPRDIYGGGDWFVICADCVWYIRNNGMDGDDWSRNNVLTGGAGAIGWRTNEPGVAENIRVAARNLV